MKLKDLEAKQTLGGKKVKTPNGVVGYWHSQWDKGIWLKSSLNDSQVFPQFVDDLKDCLEWEVTDERANCHTKTSLEDINLQK